MMYFESLAGYVAHFVHYLLPVALVLALADVVCLLPRIKRYSLSKYAVVSMRQRHVFIALQTVLPLLICTVLEYRELLHIDLSGMPLIAQEFADPYILLILAYWATLTTVVYPLRMLRSMTSEKNKTLNIRFTVISVAVYLALVAFGYTQSLMFRTLGSSAEAWEQHVRMYGILIIGAFALFPYALFDFDRCPYCGLDADFPVKKTQEEIYQGDNAWLNIWTNVYTCPRCGKTFVTQGTFTKYKSVTKTNYSS